MLKRSAIFTGIFAAVMTFIDINAMGAIPWQLNKDTKRQAGVYSVEMYDNQVNIFLGKNEEGHSVPVCVTTFKPEQLIGYTLPSLGFPWAIVFKMPGRMTLTVNDRNTITLEKINNWRSTKRCDITNILFPRWENSIDYPEKFNNYNDMIKFLRKGYLGEKVTEAVKSALKRVGEIKKICTNTDEVNIEFCNQFLTICSSPESTVLNRWLDHTLKHFIKNKQIELLDVITVDSDFYLSSIKSSAECEENGEMTSNTISLCDVFNVVMAILKHYPVIMTYEKGYFTLQAAKITKTADDKTIVEPLDYVELPNNSLQGWEGLIQLDGMRGTRLSDFIYSWIIKKDKWPTNASHTFFFKITIGYDGVMGGSMYEIVPPEVVPLLSDNTTELRNQITTGLQARPLNVDNESLIQRFVAQRHALSMFGITEERLKDLSDQPGLNPAVIQELEITQQHPNVSNAIGNLLQESIDNMRLISVLNVLPFPNFLSAFNALIKKQEDKHLNCFNQQLDFLQRSIKNPRDFKDSVFDADIISPVIKLILLTHPELIEQVKKSCYSQGKKKYPLMDQHAGFLREILKEVER